MNINELFIPKYISIFISVVSLILLTSLLVGDRRRLTSKRIMLFSLLCVMGFVYYLNQP
jgi:hypothetical protein